MARRLDDQTLLELAGAQGKLRVAQPGHAKPPGIAPPVAAPPVPFLPILLSGRHSGGVTGATASRLRRGVIASFRSSGFVGGVTPVAAPGLTYGSPAEATVGEVYSLTPTVTGSGVLFSLVSGTLPTGLSLNPTTGAITGTPTVDGTFAGLLLRASNAGGVADDTISITVNPDFDLDAELALWSADFNPVAGNVTVAGDLVSSIVSSGTDATAYVQATEANKPGWAADGGNGQPCIVFADTTDTLRRSSNTPWNTNFTNAEAFAILVFEPSVTLSGGISDGMLRLASARLVVFSVNMTAQVVHNDGVSDTQAAAADMVVDTPVIIAVRHTGGNVGISINGGAWAEKASGNTTTPTSNGTWDLGEASLGSFAGKLYRAAWNDAQPADYAALVAALAARYGVTL